MDWMTNLTGANRIGQDPKDWTDLDEIGQDWMGQNWTGLVEM